MNEEIIRVPGLNLELVSLLMLKIDENTATVEDYQTIDHFMGEFNHVTRPEIFDRLRDAGIYSWEAFIIERNKPAHRRKEIADVLPGAFRGFLRGAKRYLQLGEIESDYSEPIVKGRTRW
jgi:hypothetical protein